MGIAYTDTVMGIVLHTLAALGYAALAVGPWRALLSQANHAIGPTPRGALAVVLVVHALALQQAIFTPMGLRLGLGLALSSTLWLGMLVYWFESLMIRVDGVRLLLLPLAALAALMPVLLPGKLELEPINVPWLAPHLLASLASYGIMVIAAMHALLMAAIDQHLHRPQATVARAGLLASWARLLDAMPPLLVLEKVLFRLLALGLSLLTIAIISGSAMSQSLGGPLLPFDHKTIFTLLAWLTFGLLLLGRQLRGWRGRIAARYTLAGLIWLLLAYAGTRFVLEVVLNR